MLGSMPPELSSDEGIVGCTTIFVLLQVYNVLYYCIFWELNKDDTYYFKQILVAMFDETATVWPLTSHLINHQSKTKKTCWKLLVKLGWTHKQCSQMDSYIWTQQCQPTAKNLHWLDLCRRLVPSRGLSKSDYREETESEKEREKESTEAMLPGWLD